MVDLSRVDWAALRAALEEELRNRGLFTWADVSRLEQKGHLSQAILVVVRPAVIRVYRQEAGLER
jgi:hypothetical protein